jgi:hypothetical protein
MNKRRKGGTKTFDELTYREQSLSLNAQILILKRSIKAHVRRALAENRKNPLETRIAGLEKLIQDLNKYAPATPRKN